MMNLDKNEFERLGIYELRNLAREMNLKSPTTCKKQTLISMILNPEKHKKRDTLKGRPAKICSSFNDKIIPLKKIENYKNNLENKINYAIIKTLIKELLSLTNSYSIDDLCENLKRIYSK